MNSGGWTFSIDRGGTFTDIVAHGPAGERVVRKLLSENPERYDDAAVAGIAAILAEAGGGEIAAVKMGTTVATNALLERKGEPVALAITAGLGDALRIGHQALPEIFALDIWLPEWAAYLITTALLFAIAGILAMVGRSQLKRMKGKPERTIKNAEETLDAIKGAS